ncbi:hypothetical protein A2130_02715 [Candidatus Woesebacteria bacterium GWC2_33_12]|nr:MAG: hypothetical protein UR29_C0013G0043 [Candidatus Woesebacteria bacterium GW2011_GWC2_33_12]KKP41730.1 MAG: hypothetical protein UR33_C0011G0045 [Candidatus Woesebacteria bacterium GW2011_GWA2_33_20]OGM07348.1 MAG: hypothetical protein A2130_02715 [Candidatus Woesebacteria bacterium GWC2_33_12]OGM78583.1 MAG: hypothetical protein A2366_04705 [Candidatus Woesebacteria bacterium RIFOXYB1_FULL_33_9]OGM87160.1 MAG: hypothetical protein A2616_04255 [Candidatus Woesebacteria bacterium RIFOXYD1
MKKNKLPNIIILMILSLITVLFWISATVYYAFTAKPTPNVPTEILQDLNPRLDNVTLDQIETKTYPQ